MQKGFDKMNQLVLTSKLGKLKRVSFCGLFASDGFYYLSGLWQYMPNLRELTLWESCKGCSFDKVMSPSLYISCLFLLSLTQVLDNCMFIHAREWFVISNSKQEPFLL